MMYAVANQYFKNSKVHRYTVLKMYFRSLQVTCSYLQIYQERVYDLLGSEKSGPEVFLREHPKKGMVIDLQNKFIKSLVKGSLQTSLERVATQTT